MTEPPASPFSFHEAPLYRLTGHCAQSRCGVASGAIFAQDLLCQQDSPLPPSARSHACSSCAFAWFQKSLCSLIHTAHRLFTVTRTTAEVLLRDMKRKPVRRLHFAVTIRAGLGSFGRHQATEAVIFEGCRSGSTQKIGCGDLHARRIRWAWSKEVEGPRRAHDFVARVRQGGRDAEGARAVWPQSRSASRVAVLVYFCPLSPWRKCSTSSCNITTAPPRRTIDHLDSSRTNMATLGIRLPSRSPRNPIHDTSDDHLTSFPDSARGQADEDV